MIPERKTRSFLDPVVLSRLAALPLFARRPMQGKRLGPASQPAPGFERRVRRVSQVCPRRRPPPPRLAGLSAGRIATSSRNSRPIPISAAAWSSTPAARWATARGRDQDRIRPADRGRPGNAGAPARGRDRPGVRGRRGGPEHPASPQPRAPDGDLRRPRSRQPKGETHLASVLHELAETIRQRALIVILSDLFVEPELLRGCFEHLRFRKHDVAVVPPARPPRDRLRFPPARCGSSTWKAAPRSSPSRTRSPTATRRRSEATSTT